jgi:hypothetical protein
VPLDEVARRADVGLATRYRLVAGCDGMAGGGPGCDGMAGAASTTFFVEVLEPIALAATAAEALPAIGHGVLRGR